MHKYQFQILFGIAITVLLIFGIWFNFVYLPRVNSALIISIMLFIAFCYYGYRGYFKLRHVQSKKNHFAEPADWRKKNAWKRKLRMFVQMLVKLPIVVMRRIK